MPLKSSRLLTPELVPATTARQSLRDLADSAPVQRRAAARALGQSPEAVPALLQTLDHEPTEAVRQAILDALLTLGGPQVVSGLCARLAHSDAAVRSGVVEVLSMMPDAVAEHAEALLRDPDPNVRIMALDVLRDLSHPAVSQWLVQVLTHDTDANVLGTAVDRVSDLAEPSAIPALRALSDRTHDDFLRFAIDDVIARLTEIE